MSDTQVSIADCIANKTMSMVAMARYGCHKEVYALPMTRGTYNQVRGWQIPDNENPADEGYLVVYNRGTGDEHVSWSPKHVFDDGYHALDTDKCDSADQEPPFIQRMRAELGELDDRTDKLGNGIHLAPKDHQGLLAEQLDAMKQYQAILRKRFKLLGIEV